MAPLRGSRHVLLNVPGEMGKAYLSGTRPDVEGDPKIHGKVAMNR